MSKNLNESTFVTELDGWKVGQVVNYMYKSILYRGKIEKLKIVSGTNWAQCQNTLDVKQFHWTPTRLIRDIKAVSPEEAKVMIAETKRAQVKEKEAVKQETETTEEVDFSLFI